jgi:hypothetical protein
MAINGDFQQFAVRDTLEVLGIAIHEYRASSVSQFSGCIVPKLHSDCHSVLPQHLVLPDSVRLNASIPECLSYKREAFVKYHILKYTQFQYT